MCGFAGILNLNGGLAPPERLTLQTMAASLRHRGPDEFGLYRDNRVGLAHARLSLVDLSTGQQPMADARQRCWLVFNGEIYNHVELRQELTALGHVFRTRSDTEVIAVAWAAWGVAAFERFNGQWAVALWEPLDQRLVLARDPMGICPLYWTEHQGRLLFGSEVKALFAADPTLPRALDPFGLAQTLTFWSVVPPASVFQGIRELPPGQVRVWQLAPSSDSVTSDVHTVQVLDYPNTPGQAQCFDGSLEEAGDAVLAALRQATALRMLRADVPVGSYLSGGLDSSLVAALGREAVGQRFQTFSLRFEDAEYDETPYQRLMADKLGTEHHEVLVSRRAIAEAFPQVVWHAERPVLRTAPAPLFLLSGLVRQHGIKAVLTGEGADEMFAGYDLFREGKVRRFWARQPGSSWRPLLLERLYPYLSRSPVAKRQFMRQFFGRELGSWRQPGFAHGPRWHTTAALQRLLSPDMRAALQGTDVTGDLLANLPPAFAQWDALSQDQYLEIRTLLHGYLLSSQGDRMLLGHSVEGRFPFLDKDVVTLANRLPAAYKLRVLDEKHVLKRLGAALLPADIVNRTKQPYRAPDALCFVEPNAPEYIADNLNKSSVEALNAFDSRGVDQLWRKCQAQADAAQLSNTDNMALVAVLSTQLLHSQFLSNAPMAPATVHLTTDVDRVLAPLADAATPNP